MARYSVHLTSVDQTYTVEAPSEWAAKWTAVRRWRRGSGGKRIRTGATVTLIEGEK